MRVRNPVRRSRRYRQNVGYSTPKLPQMLTQTAHRYIIRECDVTPVGNGVYHLTTQKGGLLV